MGRTEGSKVTYRGFGGGIGFSKAVGRAIVGVEGNLAESGYKYIYIACRVTD